MYAISYHENGYLELRYSANRKSAKMDIENSILNCLFEIFYNEKPQTKIIKNNELKNFLYMYFEQNKNNEQINLLTMNDNAEDFSNRPVNILVIKPCAFGKFIKETKQKY